LRNSRAKIRTYADRSEVTSSNNATSHPKPKLRQHDETSGIKPEARHIKRRSRGGGYGPLNKSEAA